jgi:glycosyltransferase involved in cell wall biosynthesis
LGIDARIEWRGAMTQQQLLQEYRAADLFVLASKIARDGDRDGLPNVLMEAQSQGLACLATRVSAIPELIEDGVTGVLVDPESADPLARQIARLIRNPALRAELGRAGQIRLAARFAFEPNLIPLAEKFGLRTSAATAGLTSAAG